MNLCNFLSEDSYTVKKEYTGACTQDCIYLLFHRVDVQYLNEVQIYRPYKPGGRLTAHIYSILFNDLQKIK